MATFQAKKSWERLRKSDKKNYRFDHFLPDPKQRIPKKITKKSKKLKSTVMAYCKANPGQERQRKSERKKLSFRSFPT